jgi:hypothetical protein
MWSLPSFRDSKAPNFIALGARIQPETLPGSRARRRTRGIGRKKKTGQDGVKMGSNLHSVILNLDIAENVGIRGGKVNLEQIKTIDCPSPQYEEKWQNEDLTPS